MTARVLIVDDEPRYRELYAQILTQAKIEVKCAANVEEAEKERRDFLPDMIISDVRMPGASGLELLRSVREEQATLPFLLVTAYADVREAVTALKLGAVDYLSKPVDLEELLVSVQDALGLSGEQDLSAPPAEALGSIIAESDSMRGLLREAWPIAQSDVNAMLGGESGSGKEVLARFLHRNSSRAKGPFIAVNCAALPSSLLSSELFGHERGAFTGATAARKGRFREAEGGVLFLDEIGDMPLELQPILLRVIEQRCVTPLGASKDVPVDFRLVVATHRSLEEEVEAGRFRADLYYRLNVIALNIPALRDRKADILPLARSFLAESGSDTKRLAHGSKRLLEAYPWPGNIRELQNAMKRAHLLSRGDIILPEHLPQALQQFQIAKKEGTNIEVPSNEDGSKTLKENEIETLRAALLATQGNRTKAAERLGISRRGLLKKMKRFEIED